MDAEDSNRLKYTFSRYVAEQFSERYEVYVCPYYISVYSKKTGVYTERTCAPIFDRKPKPNQEKP